MIVQFKTDPVKLRREVRSDQLQHITGEISRPYMAGLNVKGLKQEVCITESIPLETKQKQAKNIK